LINAVLVAMLMMTSVLGLDQFKRQVYFNLL